MLARDVLRTPLAALMETDGVPASLQPLFAAVWARVIRPLKEAEDDESWAETLGDVLEHWLRLRLAFTSALMELEQDTLVAVIDDATRPIDEIPLTLLHAPAHGAARYAMSMLVPCLSEFDWLALGRFYPFSYARHPQRRASGWSRPWRCEPPARR